MSGSLFGQEVNPSAPTNLYNDAYAPGGSVQEQQLLNNLATSTMGSPTGGLGQFIGVPGYTGPLAPDQNQGIVGAQNSMMGLMGGTQNEMNWLNSEMGTGQGQQQQMLDESNWLNSEMGTGQGLQSQMLGNMGSLQGLAGQLQGTANQYGSGMQTGLSNMLAYGGYGGQPLNYMNSQAMFGANPGSLQGNQMSLLSQYGAGSQGQLGMANIAQGNLGAMGQPLQSVAGQGAASGLGGLQGIIAGQGNPINQLPAWQSMVQAQQQNIQQGQNSLLAQAGAGDNQFSNAYGTADQMYMNQAIANQNAQLTSATAQAQQQAQQNLLSASGTMGGFGYGAAGQLANMGYGAQNTMYGGALTGMQNLLGTQNAAAQQMYGAQNAAVPQFQNYQLGLGNQALGYQSAALGQGQLGATYGNQALGYGQLGNQYANTGVSYGNQALGYGQLGLGYGGLSNQTAGTVGSLGQMNYGEQQNAISNQYQNWLYQQPQNNPFLSMMYQAGTNYPSPTYPTYQPGAFGSIMQGVGSLLGGVGALAAFSGAGGTGVPQNYAAPEGTAPPQNYAAPEGVYG